MGGFSLQDVQSWEKTGRKRGMAENLMNVMKGGMEGLDSNRKRGMEDALMKGKMREYGFEEGPGPMDDGGIAGGQQSKLAALLGKLAGGGQGGYNYAGKPVSDLDKAKTRYYDRKGQSGGKKIGSADYNILAKGIKEESTSPIGRVVESLTGGLFGGMSKEGKAQKEKLTETFRSQFDISYNDVGSLVESGKLTTKEEVLNHLIGKGKSKEEANKWIAENIEE